MSQTRLQSLIEACTDTAIGFVVAMCAQTAVAHLYHLHTGFQTDLQITLIFTVISLTRRYITRRWFNRRA